MINFLDISPSPHFVSELPADDIQNNESRNVHEAFFSYVPTKKPGNPALIHLSKEFLKELDVEVDNMDELRDIMSGAKPFHNFPSYAMCYGGHQFGNWAGQLGDGRAITIAELDIKDQNWKFQLKGSGPTPYSRRSDGLAVLRSSVREYLCSEAMHHLGVPTTRALSLVETGDLVPRDILYNGNVQDEKGAVVCRVSPSFIRFGNFEIFASRKDLPNLRKLADYTLKHHFPHLGAPSKESYLAFFKEVATSTKDMIVHWKRVGFVHGVMNTDNMSILGLTIDYGPYGWLENYDPYWTPNTTDASHKRYRFGAQHEIGLWNLLQLANAIYPLIEEVKPLEDILMEYKESYLNDYHVMMLEKLGLYQSHLPTAFVQNLTDLMGTSEIDMTLFFRDLSTLQTELNLDQFWSIIEQSSYKSETELLEFKDQWAAWFAEYQSHIKAEGLNEAERSEKMKLVNPKYVLRNYMAQLAIDEADKGNYELIDELYQLLQRPYNEQPDMQKWFAKRPDWAKEKVGCSMLSCSS